MKNSNIKIAPSILSADFSIMGQEVKELEACGADIIHCDVMDGVFVPNITFGIKMIADLRKCTKLPLDAHLMIVNPEKYVERFQKAGADYITVHYEACGDKLTDVLKQIKSCGAKCGAVINPDADAEVLKDVVPLCDMILVMSVFPGFGGQSFIESTLKNVEKIRKFIDESKKDILLEVDGGVNLENAARIKAAGANVLVAGSTVFNAPDKAVIIKALKQV